MTKLNVSSPDWSELFDCVGLDLSYCNRLCIWYVKNYKYNDFNLLLCKFCRKLSTEEKFEILQVVLATLHCQNKIKYKKRCHLR